ncbi:DUF805 domain-containing protein [Vogesella amnigena]|uniref:DUF805 domain-containing protein n=1 Tax=Vogesella amnigena TaxID=1507449 RepID=A0ABV7TTK0_9NEIS
MTRYFLSFNGRLNRKELITRLSLLIFSSGTPIIIITELLAPIKNEVFSGILFILLVVTLAVVFIGSLSIQARRWHDTDRSGWHVLLNFTPGVSALCFLFLIFCPGTPGQNQYNKP